MPVFIYISMLFYLRLRSPPSEQELVAVGLDSADLTMLKWAKQQAGHWKRIPGMKVPGAPEGALKAQSQQGAMW